MIPLRGRGFTMVETALATVVVGVMLVAALQTLGAARIAQARSMDRIRGVALAADLMSEITALPFREPSGMTAFLGPGPDEITGTRAKFDDVDDYDGWSESPPQARDGIPLPGFQGWSRSVTVRWIMPMNPVTPSGSATEAKRIDVTVHRQGRPVASLMAIRTAAR